MAVDRQTVDLSAYPDLVVFYLGIRVRRPRGMLRLFGLAPQIQKSWKAQPDGLLILRSRFGQLSLSCKKAAQ